MARYAARLAFLVILVTGAATACSSGATPPGASKTLGSSAQEGYVFLRWQEGLEVMIWHDLSGEGTADSSGFVEGRFYIERGSARSKDGRSLAWEIRTVDGRQGEMQLQGVHYDLAAGGLFLLTTQGGTTTVKQLPRDLSDVPLDHDGILAFAGTDPDLTSFLNWGQILAYHADTVDDLIRQLLGDYSQALASGQIARPESYSPAMRDLIAERRAYYQEFFQVALHSSLLGIHSRYKIDSVEPDTAEEGLYDVQAVEMVTLRGRFREPTPEEYTSTRSALWALARTDHPAVQEALQEQIAREMAGYLAGIDTASSYEMAWIRRHHLLVREDADGLIIVQDTFDDKARDNPDGTDVVDWVDGQFVRRKPDLTLAPNYAMYHEPLEKVEAEGRRLLESYTRRYGGTPAPDPHPGWLTYTHPTHGFSFRHPPDWPVVDGPGASNIIRLRHGEPDAVELTIGFRLPEEEAPLQRTGAGAGDVEAQGSVRFLGRDLAREVLVYEGRVKAVLYNNAREIDVDGLVFTLNLDARGLDYNAARIEPERQAIADEIVGSFVLSANEAEP